MSDSLACGGGTVAEGGGGTGANQSLSKEPALSSPGHSIKKRSDTRSDPRLLFDPAANDSLMAAPPTSARTLDERGRRRDVVGSARGEVLAPTRYVRIELRQVPREALGFDERYRKTGRSFAGWLLRGHVFRLAIRHAVLSRSCAKPYAMMCRARRTTRRSQGQWWLGDVACRRTLGGRRLSSRFLARLTLDCRQQGALFLLSG